ncbi:MAG: sigma factor, partial [Myxococcota bacterium]
MDKELHEDRGLLEAFRSGDAATLGQMYRRYAPALNRFVSGGFSTTSDGRSIRISIEDPNERMEIIQETFARAFTERNRLAYDGYRPYGPYLVRICRNLVIDHVRAKQRRDRLFVADTPVGDEPDAPTRIDMASDSSVAEHMTTGGAAQVNASRREMAREL